MLPANAAQWYYCYRYCTYKTSPCWFKEMRFGNLQWKFMLVEKKKRIQWKLILIKMPFMWHVVSFLSRGSLLKDSAVYKTDLCCVGITQNQGARAVIKLLNLMLWIQVIWWGQGSVGLFLYLGCRRGRIVVMCQAGLLMWGQSREGYWEKNWVPSCRRVFGITGGDRFRQIGAQATCSSKPVESGHVVVLCLWKVC